MAETYQAMEKERVLLEALRRAHLYFLQSNKLAGEDWDALHEMEAAIKQAERT